MRKAWRLSLLLSLRMLFLGGFFDRVYVCVFVLGCGCGSWFEVAFIHSLGPARVRNWLNDLRMWFCLAMFSMSHYVSCLYSSFSLPPSLPPCTSTNTHHTSVNHPLLQNTKSIRVRHTSQERGSPEVDYGGGVACFRANWGRAGILYRSRCVCVFLFGPGASRKMKATIFVCTCRVMSLIL
jgi:hypothetical protein